MTLYHNTEFMYSSNNNENSPSATNQQRTLRFPALDDDRDDHLFLTMPPSMPFWDNNANNEHRTEPPPVLLLPRLDHYLEGPDNDQVRIPAAGQGRTTIHFRPRTAPRKKGRQPLSDISGDRRSP